MYRQFTCTSVVPGKKKSMCQHVPRGKPTTVHSFADASILIRDPASTAGVPPKEARVQQVAPWERHVQGGTLGAHFWSQILTASHVCA